MADPVFYQYKNELKHQEKMDISVSMFESEDSNDAKELESDITKEVTGGWSAVTTAL